MLNPILNQPTIKGQIPARPIDIERGLDYLERRLLDVGVDTLTGRMAWARVVSPRSGRKYWLRRDLLTGGWACPCPHFRKGYTCKHSTAAWLADWSLSQARGEDRRRTLNLIHQLNETHSVALSIVAHTVIQAVIVIEAIDHGYFDPCDAAPQGFPCSVCGSHLAKAGNLLKCQTTDCWHTGYTLINLAKPKLIAPDELLGSFSQQRA